MNNEWIGEMDGSKEKRILKQRVTVCGTAWDRKPRERKLMAVHYNKRQWNRQQFRQTLSLFETPKEWSKSSAACFGPSHRLLPYLGLTRYLKSALNFELNKSRVARYATNNISQFTGQLRGPLQCFQFHFKRLALDSARRALSPVHTQQPALSEDTHLGWLT